MKRMVLFLVLLGISTASPLPARTQRISVAENARQSNRAAKKQQKVQRKLAKRQRKAMKKSAKMQRKSARKANRRPR